MRSSEDSACGSQSRSLAHGSRNLALERAGVDRLRQEADRHTARIEERALGRDAADEQHVVASLPAAALLQRALRGVEIEQALGAHFRQVSGLTILFPQSRRM